jgi:PAS domain S-box-containing protein
MSGLLPSCFEDLEQAVVLFSREGEPRGCNRGAERLLGYDSDEFRHVSLADLASPRGDLDPDEIQNHLTTAVEGETTAFEWQIQRANGEPRWVELTCSRIVLEERPYALGEFRDLTAYKARGRRLKLLYRVLRHNLRNEMNLIQGRAEEVRRAIQEDDIQHQLELIRETAEEVGQLSEAVDDLERLVEQDATERRQVNVAEIVRQVADEVREEYPDATIETTGTTETFVSVDEGFRLALEHAITNAVEHNDEATPEVTVTHHTTDREAVIEIADNGPGIPRIEIRALETGPTPLEHGSGLGLSIIQWCTRSLGGEIEIDRADDRGSTVRIRLPRLTRPRDSDE